MEEKQESTVTAESVKIKNFCRDCGLELLQGNELDYVTFSSELINRPGLLLTGIALFAIMTLFSFITLPVEINASHRALAWLRNSGITDYQTQGYAFDALKWAAYTYVVAALSSLATLLYYVMIFLNRRE